MTTLYLDGATNEAGIVENEESFGDVTSIVFLGTFAFHSKESDASD